MTHYTRPSRFLASATPLAHQAQSMLCKYQTRSQGAPTAIGRPGGRQSTAAAAARARWRQGAKGGCSRRVAPGC
eukprot:gene5926-biopygen17785